MLLCRTVEYFAAYFPGAAYKFYHKLNSLSSCITYKQTNLSEIVNPVTPPRYLGQGWEGRDEWTFCGNDTSKENEIFV